MIWFMQLALIWFCKYCHGDKIFSWFAYELFMLLRNTAQKTKFSFSKRREMMVFPKKSLWNLIFLVLSGNMIFLFPENMILPLDRKWKMIFLKKVHGNMIFSSIVLKRWSFQKGPRRDRIFLVLPGKVVFFPWSENERGMTLPKKYTETWFFLLDMLI